MNTLFHYGKHSQQSQGLATALYGIQSKHPTTAFDIISYTMLETGDAGGLGVALVLYTGPADSPNMAWEVLSYVEDQSSTITGALKLLEDLQSGMGGVMSTSASTHWLLVLTQTGPLLRKGECKIRHTMIPHLEEAAVDHLEEPEHQRWEATLDIIAEEDKE
jgi:hypothetical protein